VNPVSVPFLKGRLLIRNAWQVLCDAEVRGAVHALSHRCTLLSGLQRCRRSRFHSRGRDARAAQVLLAHTRPLPQTAAALIIAPAPAQAQLNLRHQRGNWAACSLRLRVSGFIYCSFLLGGCVSDFVLTGCCRVTRMRWAGCLFQQSLLASLQP
jgi:hypothetical protein